MNKTEYLKVGGHMEDLILEHEVIKACKRYNYLGSIISQDDRSKQHTQNRITQGKMHQDLKFSALV